MFIKSIRFKIVLWYMLILSTTLTILGLALYQNFKHKLSHDMDNLLQLRAQGIVDSIGAYWEAEHLEAWPNLSERPSKIDNINFIRIAQRWRDEKNSDPALVSFIVRILDAKGKLITASKDIPSENLNSQLLLKSQSNFENIHMHLIPAKSLELRSLTMPVIENGKIAYVVQVACPLSSMQSALNHLSLLLFILFPSTVILTGLCGAFLASLALKPVHKMIDTIHQITAENLKLRIHVPNTKDELHALALTFNQMISRLDEAFSSQRQFMEDISHELKTPLSILKGELEVTLKRIRSAKEYEDVLQSNLEEINLLARIVENLLILARFDTKTMILEMAPVNVSVLINGTVEDIRILAEQKNINIVINSPQVEIKGDYDQLKRVILNLLDNAIKYTPSGGNISINVYKQDNAVQIEVADTGIGISKEECPHIFDRFYRVDKSRNSSGFGLGLSITKSIILAHQGNIQVRPNLSLGTIFTITLPAKD